MTIAMLLVNTLTAARNSVAGQQTPPTPHL